MKTQAEIDNFDARSRTRMLGCELCGGASLSCMCRKRFMYATLLTRTTRDERAEWIAEHVKTPRLSRWRAGQ